MDSKELRGRAEALGMALLFGGATLFVKVTEKGETKTTSVDIVVGADTPFTGRLSGVVNKVETPKWRDCKSGSRQACTSSATLHFEWPRISGSIDAGQPSAPASQPPAAGSNSDDVII